MFCVVRGVPWYVLASEPASMWEIPAVRRRSRMDASVSPPVMA